MNSFLKITSDLIIDIQGQSISYGTCDHFIKRKSQRAINHEMIKAVIEYGEAYFKQGIIFYVLGKKQGTSTPNSKALSNFRNTVILVSKDTNQIITCYRNSNPFRFIKKKQKRNQIN